MTKFSPKNKIYEFAKILMVTITVVSTAGFSPFSAVFSASAPVVPVAQACVPTPYCGDGIKNQPIEQCDGTDGVLEHYTCTAQCTLEYVPYCGDGIKNGAEQCDGTSGVGEHQACTAGCNLINLPWCGDGIKNGAEQCDGTDGVPEHFQCTDDCGLELLPFCGDGIVQPYEQCDDGNIINGDGCSATCIIEEPEPFCELELTKTDNVDPVNPGDELIYHLRLENTGTADCTGGGVRIQDEFDSNTEYVSSSETPETITATYIQWNFGTLTPGEIENLDLTMLVSEETECGYVLINKAKFWSNQTDWGNYVIEETTVECPPVPYCGDGAVNQTSEQCDDGNIENNDGCSATCQLEPGVCDPEIELVINGSFENPLVETSQNWDIFNSSEISGWDVEWVSLTPAEYNSYPRPLTAYLELQRDLNGWGAFDGSQYAELDTDWDGPDGSLAGEPASAKVYQNIPTIPGENYIVSFYFSPRPDTGLENNRLEFSWSGNVVDNNISGAGESTTVWTKKEYTIAATDSVTRLQFADIGVPSDSLGTFVDKVSVRCKPYEPYCGDGIKNGTEQCDGTDGVSEHYTCTAQCTLEYVPYCGDNIKNGTEQCDGTSGVGEHQSCTAQCTLVNLTYCGDSIKNGDEQCDGTDGVTEHYTCNSQCALVYVPYCGDQTCNGSENCITCSQDCGGCGGGGGGGGGGHLVRCGDGIREWEEQCDDGNVINGDGCSSICRTEQVLGETIETEELGEILSARTELPDTGNNPARFMIIGLILIICSAIGIKKLSFRT